MNVLVVEDEPLSRLAIERALQKRGYDVSVCSDGSQAWSVLQKDDAPELVILDWMMPGLDGIELCRRVRELRGASSPYIILLTSRDHTTDIIRGVQAGADDYITKPFDHEDLLTRVRVGEQLLALHG